MNNRVKLSWTDVWSRMDAMARQDAIAVLFQDSQRIDEESRNNIFTVLIDRLAQRIRFRRQTILQMKTPQLISYLVMHASSVFKAPEWSFLFRTYYFQSKSALMCRFLELCEIPHSADGGIDSGQIKVPEDLATVVNSFSSEFGREEVGRYFAVLCIQDEESWGHLMPFVTEFLQPDDRAPVKSAGALAPVPDEETVTPVIDGSEFFTQLDRVLIDQIIATVAGEESALSGDELIDFVDTVISLDNKRKRSYFALGFMDVLLPGRELTFNRPEMEDGRSGWYLAGVLTGCTRRHDGATAQSVLRNQTRLFETIAAMPGGSGASIAKNVFPLLAEHSLLTEATALVRGQALVAGRQFCGEALQAGRELFQKGDTARAQVLLTALHENFQQVESENALREEFMWDTRRRLAQVLQAQGELDQARRLFSSIIKDGDTRPAEALGDLGLIEAGFRQWQEVRLPLNEDRADATLAALLRGRDLFKQAVESVTDFDGAGATNAHYALAMLGYLEYRRLRDNDSSKDSLRASTLQQLNRALSGMQASTLARVYETLGLLGQCLFMQCILQMSSLDQAELQSAMNAWKRINESAGDLPRGDLKLLLDTAEVMDKRVAVEIGEAIWRYRPNDAIEILGNRDWLVDSEYLRVELLVLARDEYQPLTGRFQIWQKLIPSLLRAGKRTEAEEGLDFLEGMISERELAEGLLTWLKDIKHYDPAWSQADVLRVRCECARRLGQDEEAFCCLRELFFIQRDTTPNEASVARQMLVDFGAPEAFYESLIDPVVVEELFESSNDPAEKYLRDGGSARILFIGGNETQSQYDQAIKEELETEWPGVSILFEHTGWSSNWGRQVDLLLNRARSCQAVVLMFMMRTMLGRRLREGLNDPPIPWVPCTGTGKGAMLRSIRQAVRLAIKQKQ